MHPGTEIDDRINNVRSGLAGAKRLGSGFAKAETNPAAISTQEICAVAFLLAYDHAEARRIAELGTYLGHTANLLADLSHPDAVIEIYDFFLHSEESHRDLGQHPAYDPNDFYAIWEANTRAHRPKLDVHRGDLNATKGDVAEPLDLLFVDIVKHTSIVNTIVDPFYDRLKPGGFLLHQDYYHWQSPWIVYQMELLEDAFALVGDFGNNMSVYVKRRDLSASERTLDYVAGLGFDEKYRLFDRAIARHPGLRAGNLMASKLRLSIDDPDFDSESLHAEILEQFSHNERITRYANAVMAVREHIANTMW